MNEIIAALTEQSGLSAAARALLGAWFVLLATSVASSIFVFVYGRRCGYPALVSRKIAAEVAQLSIAFSALAGVFGVGLLIVFTSGAID